MFTDLGKVEIDWNRNRKKKESKRMKLMIIVVFAEYNSVDKLMGLRSTSFVAKILVYNRLF